MVLKAKVHSAKVPEQDGLKLLLESARSGLSRLKRDYLVRHTTDLALQAWGEPKMFADFFEDAQYRTLNFGTRREVTTVVLLVLAGDHGKDVVGRVGEIASLGLLRFSGL